jgi:transcriptional regulator with XRE-family HTH domain
MPATMPSTPRTPAGELPADVGDELGAAELTRRVAENLRRLRKERGLSFDQLAAVSGVSRAALSQIEGAKTNPTLAVLWKIAVGLAVPFQALLGVEGASKARVLRANDSLPLRSPDGRIESRLLSPAGATPGLEVYELRFLPRGALKSDPHGAGTSETLVVLTGALRVSVGEERYDLAAGDSIYFAADVPHQYENRSSRESRCLDVITYGRGAA